MANMELKQFLKQNKEFELRVTSASVERVVCTYNGHELLPRLSEVQAYIKSKSYIKARDAAYDYTQYEPHIVPAADSKYLQCNLTKRLINKKPDQVEAHIKGQRYQKLLKEWEAEQEAKKEDEIANGGAEQADEEELWLPLGESDEEDSDEEAINDVEQEDEEEDGERWMDEEDDGAEGEEDEEEGEEEEEVEEQIFQPKKQKSKYFNGNGKHAALTKNGVSTKHQSKPQAQSQPQDQSQLQTKKAKPQPQAKQAKSKPEQAKLHLKQVENAKQQHQQKPKSASSDSKKRPNSEQIPNQNSSKKRTKV